MAKTQEGFESVFLRSLPQLGSALFICFCALIWPIYAWQITGRIDAYTATETAWRQGDLAPVAPWISQGIAYFGYFTILLFPLLIVGYAAFLASPLVKRVLASPIILWCACYGAYLLISSTRSLQLSGCFYPSFHSCFPSWRYPLRGPTGGC